MEQNQRSSSKKPVSSTTEPPVTDRRPPEMDKDTWSDVSDPSERRKIQNKLAQRRFRDRIKEQKEEAERDVENRQKAGSSYAPPELGSLDTNQNLSGLPWGGFSMKHMVEQGKNGYSNSPRSISDSRVYHRASSTEDPDSK